MGRGLALCAALLRPELLDAFLADFFRPGLPATAPTGEGLHLPGGETSLFFLVSCFFILA